jgi:hypothetical protein
MAYPERQIIIFHCTKSLKLTSKETFNDKNNKPINSNVPIIALVALHNTAFNPDDIDNEENSKYGEDHSTLFHVLIIDNVNR